MTPIHMQELNVYGNLITVTILFKFVDFQIKGGSYCAVDY